MATFYAFVNQKKADEVGLDLSLPMGPYGIFNSGLDEEDYAVFSIDSADSEKFMKYDNDPKFTKIVVSGN